MFVMKTSFLKDCICHGVTRASVGLVGWFQFGIVFPSSEIFPGCCEIGYAVSKREVFFVSSVSQKS